jgi:PAS domain S-box-containing protein
VSDSARNTQHSELSADSAQGLLNALLTSSRDAIIATTLDGVITGWNRAAESIFGYSAADMIGQSIRKIGQAGDLADDLTDDISMLARLRAGEQIADFDTVRLARDGRLIHVTATINPVRGHTGRVDGALILLRDNTVLNRQENEIKHLARLYMALSQINQAILRFPDRQEILTKVCRILVEDGGFAIARVTWHDPATQELVPQAQYCAGPELTLAVKVYADERPEGMGPSGITFRSGRTVVCNDIHNDPSTLLWRSDSVKYNLRSCATFPIRVKGQPAGVMIVYSHEVGYFQEREIALLNEAAGDVSFALDNILRDNARHAAEEAARREKLFTDVMIDSMPGIVYFYDHNGRFIRWNRNFEVVSGYSNSEIAEMQPLDFFTDEDKALLESRIAEVFDKGESSVEASFLSKNGTLTPYYFTGRRVVMGGQECLVGVGVDITERKVAEAALRASEAEFRALTSTMPQIVWRGDPVNGLTYLNDLWPDYTGVAISDSLGHNWFNVMHPDDVKLMQNNWYTAIDKRATYSMEVRMRRADGIYRWWLIRGVPIADNNGEISKWIGTCTDVHELKETQEQLRKSQRLEVVGQLTGGVAHDFNNILHIILANVEALEDEKSLPAATQTHINQIGKAVERANGLIKQLLAFSRKQFLYPIPTNINNLIQATGKLIRLALGEHIDIDMSLADNLWNVNVDQAQFESALVNLCVNARDAMPEGGRMVIETQNVTLADNKHPSFPDAAPGEYVSVTLTDSGMGIPPEIINRVFEPFFTTKSEGKGSGLGLSMVYGFIKQSLGHIEISSEPGHGTSVHILLPRSKALPGEKPARPIRSLPGGQERILLVDDDPMVRSSVLKQLNSLGYQVTEAKNAKDAIKHFETAVQPFDLILSDVVMPGGVSGWTLANEVRRRWPEARIVLMSGYADGAGTSDTPVDKSVRLLSKPFGKAELALMVRQALDGGAPPAVGRLT